MENILLVVVFAALFGLAIYYYTQYNRKNSGRSQRELMRGLLAIIDSDMSTAISRLKDAAQSDTNNLDAYIVLSELLSRRGSFAEADKVLQSLLLRSHLPKDKSIRTLRASAENALRSGNSAKAIEYSDRARQLDGSPRTLDVCIRAAESTENWEKAYRLRTELMKLDKQKKHRKIMACYLLERAKQADKANELCQKAMDLDSLSPFPMLFIGDNLKKKGKLPEAIKQWEDIAFRLPEYSELVFGRLEAAYYEVGEFGNTIAFYRKLSENDVAKIPALKALAEIYFKMGDWEKALETLRSVPDSDLEAIVLKIKIAHNEPLVDMENQLDRLSRGLAKQHRPVCSSCGSTNTEHGFRCTNCGGWNTLH